MTGYGGPEGDDIVEQDGDRLVFHGRLGFLDRVGFLDWLGVHGRAGLPDRAGIPGRVPAGRRPSRGAAILGIVGLVAGLVAGYVAGKATSGAHAAPAAAVPSASAIPVYAWIQQGLGWCSGRDGRDLQLGIEVANQSGSDVTLERVRPVLPLGGLQEVSWSWGPCGSLPVPPGPAGRDVPVGANDWFTMTFRVLVKCPVPLPVQFVLTYKAYGRTAAAQLEGFPDLGEVPYPGCPAR